MRKSSEECKCPHKTSRLTLNVCGLSLEEEGTLRGVQIEKGSFREQKGHRNLVITFIYFLHLVELEILV